MPPEGAFTYDFKHRFLKVIEGVEALKKILLIIVGTMAVAVGIIGIFIPVLPTTPFLLLAAACYGASSKKFYDWLMTNRWFGSHLKNYREGRGLPIKVKAGTIALMWSTMAISIAFFVDSPAAKAILLVIAVAVSVHILMIKTMEGRKK